ncbi:hypothetical protein C8035_v011581 [Colletotrichum spinosum]|uniref:F-box domain-containing protein n=1 Tax=Colletotrichum spinosum TaxID=1347390 RepID=A0A4R8Q2Q7_9PEZI|nr:hypothetical protein C8035_v011581 [Colletotrichum spinosum]
MPPFHNLPITVIEDILEMFCIHCTPVPFERHANHGHDRRNTDTLVSLCRSSRVLSSMAMPLLYHQPVFYGMERGIPLIRTLLERPELARHVKCLHFEDSGRIEEPDELSSYELSLFKKAAAEFDTIDIDGDWLEQGKLLDILVAKCPNIEHVGFQSYYNDEPWGIVPYASLPNIKSLALSHGDTEMGCHMGTIEPMLEAAVNVTRLTGTMVTSLNTHVRLKKLLRLELLQSELEGRDLSDFLACCPALEELRYESGGCAVGYENHVPREFQTAVLTHARRLKKLTYCLEMVSFDQEPLREDMMLQSLAGLERLEELAIDTRSMMVHQDPNVRSMRRMPDGTMAEWILPVPELSPTALVDLLPASIRSFRLSQAIAGKRPELAAFLPAIICLGKHARERFPDLKKVTFSGLPAAAAEEARPVFESQGVAFSVDFPHMGYLY